MLCLARAWGYASDLWTRRGVAGGTRKRARAAAAAPRVASTETQPSANAASRTVGVPRQLTVVEPLVLSPDGAPSTLRALWRSSADCFLGTACRIECRRVGLAFFNEAIDAEYAAFDVGSAAVVAQVTALEVAQLAWNQAMRAHLLATQVDGGAEHAARLVLPDGRLPLCVAVALDGGRGEDVPVEGLRPACAACSPAPPPSRAPGPRAAPPRTSCWWARPSSWTWRR
jgi:hypothetical protein